MSDLREIYLYNTASREKEKFEPISDGEVRFYSCGQTIYEDIHVGNAKTYVAWDVLVRVFKHFGYKVKHIQNITDVGHLTDDADQGEDKIEKKAKEMKEHPMELVDRQIKRYWEDMDAINVHRPDVAPRATGHIPEMIEMVETLIEKGYGYEEGGSIYYDTSKFEDYGKMARLKLDEQEVGVRDEVKVIEEKRNPTDFALWIEAPSEHIMKYHSPWGKGYPGWHIECSAMAIKYLGDTIDIHSGGIDHIPVHHTNEIAQAEAATGKKFVNYWLHSEFITLNGEKMSKSTGNFYTLRDLLDEVGPGAARFTLTQAQYRTQADFSLEKARAAQTRFDRLTRSYHFARQHQVENDILNENEIHEEFMEKFNDGLADDLNTPKAMTIMDELVEEMDNARETNQEEKLITLLNSFETMMDVLGIPLIEISDDEIHRVNEIVDYRIKLRKDGKWETADALRDHLAEQRYVLNDISKEETTWFKTDHD